MTEETDQPAAVHAASPYSTGAGGVTLERRIVTIYFARMLAGRSASEIGGGRIIERVAVQQGPDHAVDDIILTAVADDSTVTIAAACRRRPAFTTSDTDTRKLFKTLLQELATFASSGEQRLVIAVGGHQDNASQVQELADLAREHAGHASFTQALATAGRFRGVLVSRLGHLKNLIAGAFEDIGDQPPELLLHDDFDADYLTWFVLKNLWVTSPRVESPDETDWDAAADMLVSLSRTQDADGGIALRDALAAFVDTLEPAGGVANLGMLRRAVHPRLHHDAFRNSAAWKALSHLTNQVVIQTRSTIGVEPDALHLERSDVMAALDTAVSAATTNPLVVVGPSGSGKTSLLLNVLSTLSDDAEYAAMTVRDLPARSVELRAALGGELAEALSMLRAPRRYLIIDGAEAALEERRELIVYLVAAARAADISVLVTTTPEGEELVTSVLADQGMTASRFAVEPLTDDEVGRIGTHFPQLAAITSNTTSRDLLRRPVVADLLVRARFAGAVLSEGGAMAAIWDGLIRKSDRLSAADSEARERVVRALAASALHGTAVDEAALDATAIAALRSDGVLRPRAEQPWDRKPAFAHDQLRAYAVAALLAGAADPVADLMAAGVPRWSLPAMRIAAGLQLETAPDAGASFRSLQAALDTLAPLHGMRWADVPSEALLVISDPGPALRDLWADLVDGDAVGLDRLLRILDQRHRDQYSLRTDAFAPVLEALLDNGIPSGFGKRVSELTNDWLRTLAMQNMPAGHPLRLRLTQQVFDNIERARQARAEADKEAAARRAARTPEEVAAEEERLARARRMGVIMAPHGRSRPRRHLPSELTDEWTVKRVALLGPDAGEQGADLLRRIAAEDGQRLSPAVESLGAALAITQLDKALLARLTEAYYIEHDDEDDEWGGGGLHDDGIRGHDSRELGVMPLAALYRGPFLWLFRADFIGGVRVLNQMLNHAVAHRERLAIRGGWSSGQERINLAITGQAREYIGDDNVWRWHAGTGAGPYPCMSALQALEQVVNELLEYGVPLHRIVELLLDGCESLAMVALVVRLLVQRLTDADALLDPFLREPAIWGLEFRRSLAEGYGLRMRGDQPDDTRDWNFRDVCFRLVLAADPDRRAALRTVGDELVNRAKAAYAGRGFTESELDEHVAIVRGWAAYLDVANYRREQLEDGRFLLSVAAPEDVVAALSAGNEETARTQRALALPYRYIKDRHSTGRIRGDAPIEELLDDVGLARSIQDDAPGVAAMVVDDGTAAVAAAVVASHVASPGSVPTEDVAWAATTLINATASVRDDDQHFTQGADRSAALALPLLLLVEPAGGGIDQPTVIGALQRLATGGSAEAKMYLAAGLALLFTYPCSYTDAGPCVHEVARDLLVDSARSAVIGPWNAEAIQRDEVVLADPLVDELAAVSAGDIISRQLSPAIRGLAAGAVSQSCVADQARTLVMGLLQQQARGSTSHDSRMYDSESVALTAARAALTLAAHGDDAAVLDLLSRYASQDHALSLILHGLAAAAEEDDDRAATLRALWPEVIATVLGLVDAEALVLGDGYFDAASLAALMPYAPTPPNMFRQRELDGEARAWRDVKSWHAAIEQWLPYAAGRPACLDHLVWLTDDMNQPEKSTTVLPWVERILATNAEEVVSHSQSLIRWVRDLRPAVVGTASETAWRRVADVVVLHGGAAAADLAD